MKSIALSELNQQIKEEFRQAFSDTLWVRAEISELQENYSGHCYLELIEKNIETGAVAAKLRANCWATTYRMLKPYFETTTGQELVAGIKVLLCGTVEFHEVYGISFNIRDIDPTYTLGDMARRRREILNRLCEEGVADMNKELEFPELMNRIAVISSQTAAGYGDFIDQLERNSRGFRFYCKLFPAVMQGGQTESSVIAALDRIYKNCEHFDAVVIIRGGGATADLASFDSYDLAYYCTQFPLPIITGIGHQRDRVVLDEVAHTALKTPTAVAELLIGRVSETADYVEQVERQLRELLQERRREEEQHLSALSSGIFNGTKWLMERQKHHLSMLLHQTQRLTVGSLLTDRQRLREYASLLKRAYQNNLALKQRELSSIGKETAQTVRHYLEKQHYVLNLQQQRVQAESPELLLKKGYSITLHQGKAVKSSSQLQRGDRLLTRLSEGMVESVVD